MTVGLSWLHPGFLALLVLLPALAYAWRRWPPPLTGGRGRLTLALRLLLVGLLVLALAGTRVTTQPTRRAVVAVVDVSDSVRDAGPLREAAVRALVRGRGPDDLVGIVTAGGEAAVEMPLTKRPEFDTFQTKPDPRHTDLAGALRLAAGLIPEGYARQLLLVSDGRQNLGDAAATAAALRAEGVRIDVLPVGAAPRAEALVAGVDGPSELREGQGAELNVRLRSTGPAQAVLTLVVDDREVASREVQVPLGGSSQAFTVGDLGPGLHRVRVEMQVQPDTYADNNIGVAALRVLGRPQVLVLEGAAGEGGNIQSALEAAGVAVDRRPASQAPTDTTTLGRYDATVIVDAPADRFPGGSLAAIDASVRDLGRGLVAVGGPTSYGAGGWQGTPLEAALPVRMDVPQRKDKPKVAVVLVMESMEDPRADQVALGAAEAVIDKLSPEDQVGVTDGRGEFVVRPQPVGSNKKAIEAQVERAQLSDAPSYQADLRVAGTALLQSDAPLKHIVLLGDGDADMGQSRAPLQSLLEGLRGQGVTTSAVAIDVHGSDVFMATMQDLAAWGGGRFYQSSSASQVPDLFLKETETSLRSWYEQDPFHPRVTAAGNLLQGVPLDAFPQLGGYVVATAKPGSEVYLASPKQDPVLSAWSYGLGRAVAWSSDSTGLWTAALLRSTVAPALFGHMLLWTLPDASGDRLAVQARPSGDGFDLTVEGPAGGGGTVAVGVVRPDLTAAVQPLVAVGPGRWQGHLAGADVGTYLLHASLVQGGRTTAASDAAFAMPYSPEYLDLGRDEGLLREVVRLGSGALLADAGTAWKEPPLPVPLSSEIFWALLAAAAALWPLDIFVRRVILSPRELGALAAEVAARRRPSGLELAAPEELVRLRARVSSTRRARPAAAPPPPVVARPIPGAAGQAGVENPQTEEDEASLSARLLDARRKRGAGP